MKTVKLSILLSLVLLFSGAYAEHNSLTMEGMALGGEFCDSSEIPVQYARNCPHLKKIIRVFSEYEPSTRQFKQAFSDLKTIFSGMGVGADMNVRRAIKNGSSQNFIQKLRHNASRVKLYANLVIKAENIGQVFINIGNLIKSLTNKPLPFQVPRNLNLRLNTRSQAYTLSKELSNSLFTVITDYAALGRYETSLQKVKTAGMTLFMLFQMKANPRGNAGISAAASLMFNVLIGFKEGLKAFSLRSRLAKVKPFKATLIRFIHSLSLQALEVSEVILKGGRPDRNGIAQAFIHCGKELEATS